MAGGPLTADRRDQVLRWLQEAVPPGRCQHILRVEAMAIALAERHGVDPARAQAAGLMHDLAKCFAPQRLLAIAAAEGWTLDPVEARNPHLLHAPVGAVVARDTFGIQDEDILRAIAHHTLGDPAMDALSCVVYLADHLEPGRGREGQLPALRQLSYQDLRRAVYETVRASLKHLLKKRQPLHPRTVLTLNAFL